MCSFILSSHKYGDSSGIKFNPEHASECDKTLFALALFSRNNNVSTFLFYLQFFVSKRFFFALLKPKMVV